MASKNETETGGTENTKSFIKNYWPKAMMIAGGAGLVGAAVWLTARYLRESKKRSRLKELELLNVEREVEASSDQMAVLLETGTYLGDISGEDGKKALVELVESTDNDQAKEALEVLREVISVDGKKDIK